MNVSRDRRLPILYYLKGEKEKGLKFIEETIKKQQQSIGMGQLDSDYMEFAERYKDL